MGSEVDNIIDGLPAHWERTTLGTICERGGGLVQTGPFGSQLHAADYVAVGIPSIMPVNIENFRVTEQGIERVAQADAERLSRHLVRPGDIVFSRRGDVERHALIRESERGWMCGTGCVLVRMGDKWKRDETPVLPEFASYWLRHPDVRGWIVAHAVGSTMPNLNTSIMAAIPFVVPPLPEQRAIARVLGGLDDKIELNRRMNRTLEDLARGVFRSWFVDFDPVLRPAPAHAAARTSPSTPPPHPRFPTRLVDSPLGPIPEGWRVGTVADLARYVNGRNFTKNATGTGRMVVRIAELNSGPGGSTVYNDVKAEPENVVHPGDLLFAWSGSLDVYRWHRDEALVNQHIFKVVCEAYPQWFVHFHLCEAMPFFQGIAADKATTMGHIKREHLRQAELALPTADVLKYAGEQIEPIYARMLDNERETLRLAATRDALLPVLLSGEVRLRNEREAERAVGDALQTTSPSPRASGNGSPRAGMAAGGVKGRA